MKRRYVLHALAFSPWLVPALARATEARLAFGFGRMPSAAAIQRVYAAGPPAAVLVYCLAPEKLLGWPWPLAPEQRAYLAVAQRQLPQLGRLAGRGSTLPMETLLSLKPDLIVDAGEADATYRSLAERTSQHSGIAYLLIDGRLAETPQQLRIAARWLGSEARGERLAAQAQAILARAAAPPQTPVAVYLARGHDGLETALSGSIHAEAITLAGMENVAARLGSGGLARVALEQLLIWQPHIVLCQDVTLQQQILQSSLWKSLPAVREGRVYCAPTQPFGWLDGPPGINRLLGLDWLLALRDDAQAAALPERVRTFFAMFYSLQLDAQQLQALLAGHPGVRV